MFTGGWYPSCQKNLQLEALQVLLHTLKAKFFEQGTNQGLAQRRLNQSFAFMLA